ncbi:MtrAB system histidine kinase MtrB [Propionicicella superfundia]|uniref:MtrAB system histidine kinase MtrB n=1 Tax=Propionicicella superfundia TaxID=348582 RepID=UPI0004117E60|nr:MtrAB system histidine kinase MtrB [Propionicicella superfundia]
MKRSLRPRTILRRAVAVWRSSLPLRVVAATSVGLIVVLTVGGWLLLQQITSGVLEGKQKSSLAEASVALGTLQQQLRAADEGVGVNERLTQVAQDAANRGSVGGQYLVLVRGPVSDIVSAGLDPASVPEALRSEVTAGDGLWVTPTEARFTDGRAAAPALAIAGSLTATTGESYQVFFVFPMTQEIQTLQVVQSAVFTVGAVIMAVLGVFMYVQVRQILAPVRAARMAAERIAAGHLSERVQAKGTDDLALLATSMNHMASELARQITQLENLSQVQQRFVSDVSHELRTPLTTIRMASDVLHEARDHFDPVARRSVELLDAELDRFEGLLTDLLEISRFDAGVADLSTEVVDLTELVRGEIASQSTFADRFGSEVRLDAPGPLLVECDPRRIRRIVRNLIDNAIEHGEGHPIDVRLARDDNAVALVVRDHGVGFFASQSQQVFNRFWRADPSRARLVGGTGLGLAIALEDARLHGGWLNAWGRPRRGAQFRLTLPRKAGGTLTGSPLPIVPADTPTGGEQV